MPIYEYRCSACGHQKDHLQKMSDAPLTTCPACGADFERLVRSSTVPSCPGCGSTTLEKAVSRIAPHARIPGLIAENRRQAKKEGHFSHYSAAEKAKVR